MTNLKRLNIILESGNIVEVDKGEVKFKRYESDYGTTLSIKELRLVADLIERNEQYFREEKKDSKECECILEAVL